MAVTWYNPILVRPSLRRQSANENPGSRRSRCSKASNFIGRNASHQSGFLSRISHINVQFADITRRIFPLLWASYYLHSCWLGRSHSTGYWRSIPVRCQERISRANTSKSRWMGRNFKTIYQSSHLPCFKIVERKTVFQSTSSSSLKSLHFTRIVLTTAFLFPSYKMCELVGLYHLIVNWHPRES